MKKTLSSPIIYGCNDICNLKKKALYKGFFTLNEYRFQFRKFDGSMSEEVCREVLERGCAVALLAYDPSQDAVILIEQIRIAALESEASPWMLELVAGMVDHADESLENVARREAAEEAGIEIGRCKEILSYLPSSGGLAEKLFIFVGEVDATTATGIHGLAEEGEDIKVHVVSRTQAYRWLEAGIINNAATIIGLQWLQLHYQQLQEEWLPLYIAK